MKNILKTLDKKLGYLIFLFGSHAIGNFLSFAINISLKSIWLSLRILMLSFNQKLSISRIKPEEDKALFWKVFNSIHVSFYSDLRTGISFSVRFASDASKITVKKCSNLFEEIEYSDDEEEIRLAQNKIFRILSIYNDSMFIRRPFYHILKERNGEKFHKFIPFRISQLNSLIMFFSIDILGLSISLTYNILIKTILIFLFGLGLGYILF